MVLVILASIACSVGGQLSFKRGMNRAGRVTRELRGLRLTAGLPQLVLGLAFYAGSTLLWLYALSRVEVSFAFPFLSLSFVAIMLGARFGLDEAMPRHRLLGSLCIVAGVLLVGLSGR